MINTIGEENIELIENHVMALKEHGVPMNMLQELAILAVPKKIISMYPGALKEIEEVIQSIMYREEG